MRSKVWVLWVLMLGVLSLFVWQHLAWRFLCDDAYISFRYAANLAEHGELVYNTDPLERVEGYTNFLWVLFLALGESLGVKSPDLASLLNPLFSLLSLLFLIYLSAWLRLFFIQSKSQAKPSPTSQKAGSHEEKRSLSFASLAWVDFWPAAWLCLSPEFMVWSSSGLEGGLALALGLGALLAVVRQRLMWAGILAALAFLTRPDSVLWIGGTLGLVFAARLFGGIQRGQSNTIKDWQIRVRPWLIGAAVFTLPVVSHFIWRWFYYGAWWPNTWAIKQHGALLSDTWGRAYLENWAENLLMHGYMIWALPLVLWVRKRHMILVLPLFLLLAYVYRVGGDFMAYSRFLLPATVGVVVLIIWLSLDLTSFLQNKTKLDRRIPEIFLGAVACLTLFGSASDLSSRLLKDNEEAHIDGRWESVHAMHSFAAIRVAAGQKMQQQLPKGTLVSVGAAGAMPYASRLPAFDSYGLVDPGVLSVAKAQHGKHARPGHQLRAPLSYVRSRKPALMCHIGTDAKRKPSKRLAQRYLGHSRASWVCFDTGPIANHREPEGVMEARQYCCLSDHPMEDMLQKDSSRRLHTQAE